MRPCPTCRIAKIVVAKPRAAARVAHKALRDNRHGAAALAACLQTAGDALGDAASASGDDAGGAFRQAATVTHALSMYLTLVLGML